MKRLDEVPDVEQGERGLHPAALAKNALLNLNALHILLADTRQKCPSRQLLLEPLYNNPVVRSKERAFTMPASVKANGLPTSSLIRSLVVKRTILLTRHRPNNLTTSLKL